MELWLFIKVNSTKKTDYVLFRHVGKKPFHVLPYSFTDNFILF